MDIAASCLGLGGLLIEHRDNHEEGCALLREAVHRYSEMGMPEAQQARETLLRLRCVESA